VVEIRLNANVSVLVWPEKQYLESRFRTGGVLPAAPNWDHAPSVRLAHEIGYKGNCYLLSRDHEILHHVTAIHLGAPWSWTLFWEAHKLTHGLPLPPRGLYRGEERRVLALQAFLNLGTRSPALDELPDLERLVAVARATLEPLESLHAT
jgi:hypothetical protein